jgi:hypothetical protein
MRDCLFSRHNCIHVKRDGGMIELYGLANDTIFIHCKKKHRLQV